KFEQVLRDDPTHVPTEFYLAVCYRKLGKTEPARVLYEKIVQQDPEIYEARFNLAVLLYESGDARAADEQFQKCAAMRPGDSRPLLFHAEFLEKSGHLDEAAETYNRAALDSSNADARRATADFYIRLGEGEHAKKNEQGSAQFFEKALSLQPDRRDLIQ